MNTLSSVSRKLWSVPPIMGALALCLVLGVLAMLGAFPPSAKAASPDWNGHTEFQVSNSQQTTGNAVVVTATTTARVQVKAMTVTAATSGTYTFFSGSTPSGAHQIAQFYLIANTPMAFTVENFRGSFKTAHAEGLYCVGAGILTYTLIYFDDQS